MDNVEFTVQELASLTRELRYLLSKANPNFHILNSASIDYRLFCADCQWPVIDCCTNWDWDKIKPLPEGAPSDWFYYCSNKACKNHQGEGVFQDRPDWVTRLANSKVQL
jgi:hypothetical protein